MNKFDITIISPHVAFKLKISEDAVYYILQGPGDFIAEEMENLFPKEHPAVSVLLGKNTCSACHLHAKFDKADTNADFQEEFSRFRMYLDMISSLEQYKNSTQVLYRQSLFQLMIKWIFHNYPSYSIHPHESKKNPLIENLLNYIKTDFKNVQLSQAAKRLNCDSSYLSRLIKKQTGKTFSEIVLNVRMRAAGQMLLQSDMSEQEISDAVGFTSLRYFRIIFKKEFAITPKKYRAQLLRKEITI